MDSSSDIEPVPVINVGPPTLNSGPFFERAYETVTGWVPSIFGGAQTTVGVLVGISFPLSLFFLIAIVYCVEQLKLIRKKEELMYDTKTEPAYQETSAAGDPAMAHRWENVTRHIDSPNANDWKQAILEADVILDDMLTAMGYRGESVGEKLKRVEPGDMRTLQDAWKAHLVRNDVAHRPELALTQHDALATVNLYRKVFEEFYYI